MARLHVQVNERRRKEMTTAACPQLPQLLTPLEVGGVIEAGKAEDECHTDLLARHTGMISCPTDRADGTCTFTALAKALGCRPDERWLNNVVSLSLAAQSWEPGAHPIDVAEKEEYETLQVHLQAQGW